MSSVTFSYTKAQEEKYLYQLLKEKKWFERKRFSVFFPKTESTIKQEIEPNERILKPKIARLQKTWRKIEKTFFATVKKFRHKRLLPSYRCHGSRFGPEGKYGRPNQLFVRLRIKRDERRARETIGHELLHLLFADFFESKKLNYPEREGMVDALIVQSDLSHLFPHYQKQSIGKVRQELLESINRKFCGQSKALHPGKNRSRRTEGFPASAKARGDQESVQTLHGPKPRRCIA